jgi:hypothetical protein
MSTKNSLILIVVIAFLALAGMGATKFAPTSAGAPIVRDDLVSDPAQAVAPRGLEMQAQHSEALAQSELARQEQRWEMIAQHSEALSQIVRLGPARAEQLWNLMVEHTEALAR